MKSEQRCHNCGLVDSIHVRDYSRSKLLWVVGPRDENNLQLYVVYCRECKHMSVFNPGWLGGWKHVFNISPGYIPLHYKVYDRHARSEDAIGVPRHVRNEMLDRMKEILREDGLSID